MMIHKNGAMEHGDNINNRRCGATWKINKRTKISKWNEKPADKEILLHYKLTFRLKHIFTLTKCNFMA